MAENNNQENVLDLSDEMRVRREKLAKLVEAKKDPFEITKYDVNATAEEILNDYEAFEGKQISVAGRIMAKRVMGKASFVHILDSTARIQLYVQINTLGEEAYAEFKTFDIGDIIGVVGEVFKTRTGETSIKVDAVKLLTKSLRPLPEKWHGL